MKKIETIEITYKDDNVETINSVIETHFEMNYLYIMYGDETVTFSEYINNDTIKSIWVKHSNRVV